MKRLGLSEPDLAWNASRDNFAKVVQTLTLLHGTFGRIAADVNLWSRTADNGINEGEGGTGSTMPRKRNPRASEFLAGAPELTRIRTAGALSMMGQSETRQGGPWITEWSTIPEMFMLTAASLERSHHLFVKLIIKPAVLLERCNDSQQYAMAEAVQAWIKRMHEMSFDPVAFGTQEFARMMAAERPQWTAAIEAAGIDTRKD